jgi:hypothetical protein
LVDALPAVALNVFTVAVPEAGAIVKRRHSADVGTVVRATDTDADDSLSAALVFPSALPQPKAAIVQPRAATMFDRESAMHDFVVFMTGLLLRDGVYSAVIDVTSQ